MAATVAVRQESPAMVQGEDPRWWWAHLLTGILWLVFGFAILNGHEAITTVWTVAVFAGFLFTAFAVAEFLTAVTMEGWRWLHALLCLASAMAALMSFA